MILGIEVVGVGNGGIIGHRDAPSGEELRFVWASRGMPVGTKSVRVVLEAASMVVFNNSHQRERVDHARTVMLASVLSPPRASASDIGTIPALVDDLIRTCVLDEMTPPRRSDDEDSQAQFLRAGLSGVYVHSTVLATHHRRGCPLQEFDNAGRLYDATLKILESASCETYETSLSLGVRE